MSLHRERALLWLRVPAPGGVSSLRREIGRRRWSFTDGAPPAGPAQIIARSACAPRSLRLTYCLAPLWSGLSGGRPDLDGILLQRRPERVIEEAAKESQVADDIRGPTKRCVQGGRFSLVLPIPHMAQLLLESAHIARIAYRA